MLFYKSLILVVVYASVMIFSTLSYSYVCTQSTIFRQVVLDVSRRHGRSTVRTLIPSVRFTVSVARVVNTSRLARRLLCWHRYPKCSPAAFRLSKIPIHTAHCYTHCNLPHIHVMQVSKYSPILLSKQASTSETRSLWNTSARHRLSV